MSCKGECVDRPPGGFPFKHSPTCVDNINLTVHTLHPIAEGSLVKIVIANDLHRELDGVVGYVKGIVGEYPVLGYVYIVDTRAMISETYPYSCVPLPQGCLRIVK